MQFRTHKSLINQCIGYISKKAKLLFGLWVIVYISKSQFGKFPTFAIQCCVFGEKPDHLKTQPRQPRVVWTSAKSSKQAQPTAQFILIHNVSAATLFHGSKPGSQKKKSCESYGLQSLSVDVVHQMF